MPAEKIAPGLLFALEDYLAEDLAGLAQHVRHLGLPSVAAVPRPGTGGLRPGSPVRARAGASQQAPKAVVFLHFSDLQAVLAPKVAKDVHVNQPAGRVRTALVPLDKVVAISDDASVQRIVPSRYLRPLLDVALGKVGIPAFRSKHTLTGKGVLIGIIDTGIDPRHAAFAHRMLRIWDQTLPGPGVPEGNYGAELTGNLLSVSRDTNGHGTHVAGIAAGADKTYGGVAPEADLLIVKTDFLDAHIADAIQYMFRVADELKRPAVVNLSLGGHGAPHDGTDSLSLIIDAASGPGRIVCCAAGNEGNDNIHAQASVGQDLLALSFRVPAGTVGMAMLNGWYTGAAELEISLRTPGGFLTSPQKVFSAGNFERLYSFPDAEIRVATPGPDPTNGDHQFFVQIRGTSQSSAVRDGVWQLRIRETTSPPAGVTVDVWTLDTPLDPGQPRSPQVFFTSSYGPDGLKIGSPGVAANAITVASYTTKAQWTDIDATLRTIGLTVNDISDFSSPGPARKGNHEKPDVAAPGAMITSSLSADSFAGRESMVDDHHLVEAGTSMATPFIAGLVAILLQRNGALNPAGVKVLLQANSAIPGQPAKTFDPKWGYGVINAAGLCSSSTVIP